MPLRNVFVLSIENYERLACAVESRAVHLPDLLKEAVEQNKDPATATMMFDAFIRKYVSRWSQTALIRDAHLGAETRIQEAFGDEEGFPEEEEEGGDALEAED